MFELVCKPHQTVKHIRFHSEKGNIGDAFSVKSGRCGTSMTEMLAAASCFSLAFLRPEVLHFYHCRIHPCAASSAEIATPSIYRVARSGSMATCERWLSLQTHRPNQLLSGRSG